MKGTKEQREAYNDREPARLLYDHTGLLLCGDAIPVISLDADPESVASGRGCRNYLFVIPIPEANIGIPEPALLKGTNAAIWLLRASGRHIEDPAHAILGTGPQKEARWKTARVPSKAATTVFPQFPHFGHADSSRSLCWLYADQLAEALTYHSRLCLQRVHPPVGRHIAVL